MPGTPPTAGPAGTAGRPLLGPMGVAMLADAKLVDGIADWLRGGTAGVPDETAGIDRAATLCGAGALAGTAGTAGEFAAVVVASGLTAGALDASDDGAGVASAVVAVVVEVSAVIVSLCCVSLADAVSVVSVGLGAAGGAAAAVASPRKVSELYFARARSAARDASTCLSASGVAVCAGRSGTLARSGVVPLSAVWTGAASDAVSGSSLSPKGFIQSGTLEQPPIADATITTAATRKNVFGEKPDVMNSSVGARHASQATLAFPIQARRVRSK